MSKHKYIDRICIVATVLSLLLAIVFLCKGIFGLDDFVKEMGYESRLFDESKVHTIDIVMEDWDAFIGNCQSEEYEVCELTIDGEVYKNVGIRGKGNTSLSNVASMGSERYSFKVEFDKYDDTKNYYGLDKLSLNNIIQDNTYMKDYLTYQMMNEFGVDSPLCSFVYITVNGEEWGLYLAVEGVEDSFLQRNYGTNYGELYKPDSMNFGAGRGNGQAFDFSEFQGKKTFSMGGSDVKLQYIDDDPDSYANIFDNAKTDITEADQKRLIQSLKILSSGMETERVVNVDKVLRYFVVHNFVCNGDSYTGSMIHNYYLYEESGKMTMIPWDYNLAYGTFQGSNATEQVNFPIDTPVSGAGTDDRPMVDWIFANESYTELYHEYFEEFLETVDALAIVESAENLISEYVEKDPTKFCTYEEFKIGVETLKEFCTLRTESVQGQLDGEIPSTENEQMEEDSMLVDASNIKLSDMGTMSNGMGIGGRGDEKREKTEEMEEFTGNFPEGGDFSQMQPPDGSGFMQGFPGQMGETTEMEEQFTSMPNPTGINGDLGNWILFGLSIAVLIVGLIVAYKFKGKNG